MPTKKRPVTKAGTPRKRKGVKLTPTLLKAGELLVETPGAPEKKMDQDDAVTQAVARLKEQGLESPYLKNFVVARINPLRFIKGELPSYDELLGTMTKRASKMDTAKISAADLSRSGGIADDE